MRVAIIAAVAENGVIGRNGDLPWRLSEDLKRFKSLTMDHPIVMGRLTWRSIGLPMPGRTSIVVTGTGGYHTGFEDVRIANSLQEALEIAIHSEGGEELIYIIGGARLFKEALPIADELYLTRVLATVEGDVLFPPFDTQEWLLVRSESFPSDEKNEFPVEFERFKRIRR